MSSARIRVKVCCIASADEAKLAISAGADAIGLVGRMPSGPGPIADELIAQIAARVPPPVATFLLTAETSVDGVVDHARRTGTSAIQLVDWVDPADHERIRAQLGAAKLVQVLHVEDERVLDQAHAAAATADALLLDSGRTHSTVRELGGTGRVHDWELSRQIVAASRIPVFLAGGLDAANVGDAIARVHPFGVDLCSGLRSEGRLDAAKLHAFFDAVLGARRSSTHDVRVVDGER
ncbi:MAG TPA: phosphoribosylanthranilate isomerase [Acidimicrobiia bacterium]|jgi:phosphoribosylanthranilate isomerase